MLILVLIYRVSSNPSGSDMIFPYYWKPAASIYHLAVRIENTFLQCCTTSTTSSSSLPQGASSRRRDDAASDQGGSPKLPCRLLCGMQTLESLNKRSPGENTWTLHLGELLFPCTILWSNLKKGYPQQNASNYFVFEMRVPRGLWWRSERAAAETHFLIPSVLCKLSLPKHSDNENLENWMLD